ncbi:hypothetical protein CVT26_008767, partial [Gymnopilus dilepis]
MLDIYSVINRSSRSTTGKDQFPGDVGIFVEDDDLSSALTSSFKVLITSLQTMERSPQPRRLCHSTTSCCSACQTLTDLDDELHIAQAAVRKAQAAVQSLLNKRDAIRINLNRSHPSIIDRLPVEIASHIFVLFVADSSRKGDPLILGAICQSWRRIAWATPGIWTSLTLKLDPGCNWKKQNQLAHEWLGRSGHLPLSITWHERPMTLDERALRYPLIDVINRLADRWRVMDLNLPSELLCRFNQSTKSSPPHLKSLVIHASDKARFTFPNFSRLKPQVVVIDNYLQNTAHLNWSLVTKVSATLSGVNDVLSIFEIGKRLQNCTFELFGQAQPLPAARDTPIMHTLISSLDLQLRNEDPMQLFFNSVTLPSLEHLRFRGRGTPFSVSHFTAFLTRSAAFLKSLALESVALTNGGFISVTRLLPSLETLKIYIRNDVQHEDKFRDLYFALGSEALLPSLQEFHWGGGSNFPWSVIPRYLVPLSPHDHTSRRPLKLIRVSCIFRTNMAQFPVIDRGVLGQLSQFRDRVDFQFQVKMHGSYLDLWEMSQNLVG